MSFTILQLVLVNETGDSYYRMRWPAEELAAAEPTWRVINLDAMASERLSWATQCDLLVVYQSSDPDLFPIIEARKRAGLKTIVEYNDNFYDAPAWSPVAQAWRSPLIWQIYERFMQLADRVIVTGPGLKDLFSSTIEPAKIEILHNHLHAPPSPTQKRRADATAPLNIGWAGSLGHMADLLAIAPLLSERLQAVPSLQLHLMGNEAIPHLVRAPADRLHFTKWGTMQQYYDFWSPVHLGIVPLLDTPYNRCRSDIKAVEIAAAGAVPLLPNSLPYQEFLENTGIRPYGSFGEIAARINEYLNNPQLLEEESQRCFAYVMKHRLAGAHTERADLYRKYLPGTPLGANWPMASGFHSIPGTPQKSPHAATVLEQTQKLLKEQRQEEAYSLLQKACADNPDHADLTISILRLKQARKDPDLQQQLAAAQTKFPRDLRFALLAITAASTTAQPALAKQFIHQLQTVGEATLRFFEKEIFLVLLRLPSLLAEYGIFEDLLNVYPNNAALKLRVAEQCERRGEYSAAAVHYAWLHEHFALAEENRETFSMLREGYLSAWRKALQARTSP